MKSCTIAFLLLLCLHVTNGATATCHLTSSNVEPNFDKRSGMCTYDLGNGGSCCDSNTPSPYLMPPTEPTNSRSFAGQYIECPRFTPNCAAAIKTFKCNVLCSPNQEDYVTDLFIGHEVKICKDMALHVYYDCYADQWPVVRNGKLECDFMIMLFKTPEEFANGILSPSTIRITESQNNSNCVNYIKSSNNENNAGRATIYISYLVFALCLALHWET